MTRHIQLIVTQIHYKHSVSSQNDCDYKTVKCHAKRQNDHYNTMAYYLMLFKLICYATLLTGGKKG